MKTTLFALLFVFAPLISHADQTTTVQQLLAQYQAQGNQPNACVNPGGSCDGSIPCCDSSEYFCIRNMCQADPQQTR
jgi:uncharacterized protein (DUF779 family)